MKISGWRFSSNIRHKNPTFNNTCGRTNTWYGDGGLFVWAQASFKGSGTAMLDYGNCNNVGKIKVETTVCWEDLLDLTQCSLKQISESNTKDSSNKVSFEFTPNQNLKITSSGNAIIKINSLDISCIGK